MTQITLNIPDSDIEFFLKLVEKFNYTLHRADGFELTKDQIDLLDKSSASETKNCTTASKLKEDLESKYAF